MTLSPAQTEALANAAYGIQLVGTGARLGPSLARLGLVEREAEQPEVLRGGSYRRSRQWVVTFTLTEAGKRAYCAIHIARHLGRPATEEEIETAFAKMNP